MPYKGDIYIGLLGFEEYVSPGGRKLSVEDIELSREDRTADGTLRTDVIAVKMRITLDYDIIDGAALITLVNLYRLHTDLSVLIYTTDIATMTNNDGDPIICRMKPFGRQRLEMRENGTWTGPTIVLDEV